MTEGQQADPGAERIGFVLEHCGLEVPDERKALLADAIAGFESDFRQVEAVEVDEVILGSVFDARWEG